MTSLNLPIQTTTTKTDIQENSISPNNGYNEQNGNKALIEGCDYLQSITFITKYFINKVHFILKLLGWGSSSGCTLMSAVSCFAVQNISFWNELWLKKETQNRSLVHLNS